MSEERKATVEDQLRNDPDVALVDALYELVQRKNTALRALWKKYKSAKADAWDEGHLEAEHKARVYGHPRKWESNRTNPYRGQEEA